jgi:thymidylate synthase
VKHFFLIFSIFVYFKSYGMEKEYLIPEVKSLIAQNVDELVLKGIKYIKDNGELFEARAGAGQQAYDVSYTLSNPLHRVHNLRKEVAIKYFSRELLAYFKGSLNVNDGLAQAASMWKTLADDDGNICSNYGYYVFHQKVPEFKNRTQYEWVITQLSKNLDSRKAFININQPSHKVETNRDFPCTLGLQFFVRKNKLCCVVSSRSTDIYTGLPYDIGFFAFVTELVYKHLRQAYPEKTKDLGLGYVTMKTNFTQIYDKTRTQALKLLDSYGDKNLTYETDMPEIHDAQETLKDIYNQTDHTPIMKWIYAHARLKE